MWFLIPDDYFVIPAMIFAMYAQSKVRSAYGATAGFTAAAA